MDAIVLAGGFGIRLSHIAKLQSSLQSMRHLE